MLLFMMQLNSTSLVIRFNLDNNGQPIVLRTTV